MNITILGKRTKFYITDRGEEATVLNLHSIPQNMYDMKIQNALINVHHLLYLFSTMEHMWYYLLIAVVCGDSYHKNDNHDLKYSKVKLARLL